MSATTTQSPTNQVSASAEQAREQIRVATLLILTGVGGYVDAVSYLGLGRVFTAAMTGNTVLLALAAAERDWSAVVRSAVALVGFVGGVALGQVVVGRFAARTEWPRAASAGLLVELALLSALAWGWHLDGPPSDALGTRLLIVASALAMGVQSATARRLGVSAVSTTYVTGTLTSLTSGTVDWLREARQRRRQPPGESAKDADSPVVHGPRLPAVAWVLYAASALAGGLVTMVAPASALLPALVAVLLLVVLDVWAS